MKAAAATEGFHTVPFDFRSGAAGCKLTNRMASDGELGSHPHERQIDKLILAFDEIPISYACPGGPDGDELQPMVPVAFNSENLSTYIGVTKYVDPGLRNGGRGHQQGLD